MSGFAATYPTMDAEKLREAITATSAKLGPGLTEQELTAIEQRFDIQFAPDHRLLLSIALPVEGNWPDWRKGDADELRHRIDWPIESILFDVRNNVFWPKSWGNRPVSSTAAEGQARHRLRLVPGMVPVYSHRYIPWKPKEPGNPVFSCYQSDVIYYGTDIIDWLHREFMGVASRESNTGQARFVPFWSLLAESREDEL